MTNFNTGFNIYKRNMNQEAFEALKNDTLLEGYFRVLEDGKDEESLYFEISQLNNPYIIPSKFTEEKQVCCECGVTVSEDEDFDDDLDMCYDCSVQECEDHNCSGSFVEKFECDTCGCYYYVKDRSVFDCPNCEVMEYNEKDED